jgi:hypothetical protein
MKEGRATVWATIGALASAALVGCSAKIDLGAPPGLDIATGPPTNGSPGCGKAWLQQTGQFVEQADVTIPGGASPDGGPLPPGSNTRGYWILVPANYDPNSAYRVIYEGVGCGDPSIPHSGSQGYAYQTIDDGEAIQVGLDVDPDRSADDCYDDRNPNSNDFYFFPWLMNEVENELCVDRAHEFISGYSTGAYLANQLGCAFPDKLRGQVLVSGGEPISQPPCVDHPIAAFFVHDVMDSDNAYNLILPACARTLRQNGCESTDCSNPVDGGATTPYMLPDGATAPTGTQCRQFTGCGQNPVVFCTTYNQNHGMQEWAVPVFWDFMKNRLQ